MDAKGGEKKLVWLGLIKKMTCEELKDVETLKKQIPTDTVFKLEDSLSDDPKVGMWLAYSINLKEARLIRREQTKVIILFLKKI